MDYATLLTNVGVALAMGVIIGLERECRQHPAGLRTNALVAVGAALFVCLSRLMDREGSPTRIAAQVVSGIGFLGGGVILREGLNVRGMNTAATLWCSAAVGTLAGAGFPVHAAIGGAAILTLNIVLRPISLWIDTRLKMAVDVESSYRIHVTCRDAQEMIVRGILLRHVDSHPRMVIQGLAVQPAAQPGAKSLVADIFSSIRDDRALEDLISRINIEQDILSVRWERLR